MKRILSNNSGKRISENAASALGEDVEDYGNSVALKAVKIAERDNRITVKRKDIKEAVKKS